MFYTFYTKAFPYYESIGKTMKATQSQAKTTNIFLATRFKPMQITPTSPKPT